MYKKHLFWLVLTLIMGASYANAQVNRSGVYYYIGAGRELTDKTNVRMFYYDGETIYTASKTASYVSAKLNEDPYYWVEYLTTKVKSGKYTYEPSLSTSKNEVYSRKTGTTQCVPPQFMTGDASKDLYFKVDGTEYYAISRDLNTVIHWNESKNSSEVKNKTYLVRVPESDLDKDPHDFLK